MSHGHSSKDIAKIDQNHARGRELILQLRDQIREHSSKCPKVLCVDHETQQDILSLSHRGAQVLLHTALLMLALGEPDLPDAGFVLTTDPHPSEES